MAAAIATLVLRHHGAMTWLAAQVDPRMWPTYFIADEAMLWGAILAEAFEEA